MSGPFAGPSNPIEEAKRSFAFPKSARLLRRADFRRVYEAGRRISNPYFAAFCAAREGGGGPRVGLAAPRALGKAVVRNRIKRRLREAVRRNLWRLGPGWDVVIQGRKAVLEAPFEELLEAVERLFARCLK
jgi:ribonuclease P protein component